MAAQETLTERPQHNPLDHGLWKRYTDGNNINHAAWLRAHAESDFVGTCRSCGGHLAPRQPHQVDKNTWYEAACVSCHKTIAAPARPHERGGRLLRHSSRHHEMPTGWWEHRNRALKTAHQPGEAAA